MLSSFRDQSHIDVAFLYILSLLASKILSGAHFLLDLILGAHLKNTSESGTNNKDTNPRRELAHPMHKELYICLKKQRKCTTSRISLKSVRTQTRRSSSRSTHIQEVHRTTNVDQKIALSEKNCCNHRDQSTFLSVVQPNQNRLTGFKKLPRRAATSRSPLDLPFELFLQIGICHPVHDNTCECS